MRSRILGKSASCVLYESLMQVTARGNTQSQSRTLSSVRVGDRASVSRAFTLSDVETFSRLTGDTNPLHLDPTFAERSHFHQPVVHGILTLGLLSAVLGTKLPGPGSVVLGLDITYPHPLFIGECVTAEVQSTEIRKRLATFSLKCFVEEQNKVVVEGHARLLLPKSLR